jgi:hypothetical protein
LISALWPEGRGNIAYGANVGSNHTGKKPDQEIRPGEGNFFGLGCSIKFPADYADAPYSLIAAGVSAAPQRVAFPFSLINGPQGDAGAGAAEAIRGLNEIVPGWMWSDNAFSLARRIYKFESGGSADPGSDPASTWNTGFFAGRIFAAGIARKVLRAYQALRSAPPRACYLEEALAGLGRNFMRAAVRDKALSAYEDYLAFFLLRAYADRPGQAWDRDLSDLVALLRAALAADASGLPDARSWAASQRARLPGFLAAATASLARDDKRGRRVFDDYADFHPPAADDPTLARLAGDLDELDRRLAVFIGG